MNKILNNKEIDITKIKLVIWDLDNTFWNGLIGENSEEVIPRNCELVKNLTDRGIVNSICSKNEFDVCQKKLTEIGMWEYFVFPSIDWTFKGGRVFTIINEMNLRPDNVLFIDDEPLNLQNVMAQNENIMCALPKDAIEALEVQFVNLKSDPTHKRLKQYKILSTKVEDMKRCSSDESFLQSSEITISIIKDCQPEFERLHELVGRTNQLNYTKLRSSKEELQEMLDNNDNECAYIKCHDKYGDYGIIGFYVYNKPSNRLIHYLFSCRTLGMGIEQYIYEKLGSPEVTVSGVVVTALNSIKNPSWISEEDDNIRAINSENAQATVASVIFKSPCDLAQVAPFFSNGINITEEFTYVSKSTHRRVESQNHTSQILLSKTLTVDKKNELIRALYPIIDEEYFSTNVFESKYDMVVLSMLVDYNLGIYRYKSDPQICIPFEQYTIDYTNEDNWEQILEEEKRSDTPLTIEFLKMFKENFTFEGRISGEKLIKNLKQIREYLPKDTLLVLIGGSEIPYPGQTDPFLQGREKDHVELNGAIQSTFIPGANNTEFIHINRFVTDDSFYADTIDHYKKVVYYQIAKELSMMVSNHIGNAQVTIKDESYLKSEARRQKINMIKRKIKNLLGLKI